MRTPKLTLGVFVFALLCSLMGGALGGHLTDSAGGFLVGLVLGELVGLLIVRLVQRHSERA